MANEEQLRILRQGVDAWNEWREDNLNVEIELEYTHILTNQLDGADFRGADLRGTYFVGTQLNGADLRSADLRGAQFIGVNLIGVNLIGADLRGTRLIGAVLSYAILAGAQLIGADLSYAILLGADLSYAILVGAQLIGAQLIGAQLIGTQLNDACLRGAVLSGAYLTDANLSGANLYAVQALETNFSGATLTGACIEDWQINSETNFENVICDYIYLKRYQQERRPSDPNRNFASGEFAKLVERYIHTVDLVFKNGIDWRAFLSSFQDLQVEYGDKSVSIQAIEKKSDGAFVIRLSVPPEADKAEIERQAKKLYETKLQVLEAQYRAELQAKDREIANYKERGADMKEIAILLASRPITVEAKAVVETDNTSNQFNAPVGSVGNQGTQTNVTGVVEGNQIGTQHNYAPEHKQTLAEAADEIQKLLQQLESSNPTATVEQQQAYVDAAMPITLKERLISALKAMSDAAIEEFLQRPGVKVVASGVKGWMLPD